MLKITQTVETVEEDYYGITLIIARANNSNFRQKFRALIRPHKRQIDAGTLPDDKSDSLLCEAMAGTGLIGWRGTFPDGQEHPFSEENAADLLKNDPDCRDFVTSTSGNLAVFLVSQQEEQVKKQ